MDSIQTRTIEGQTTVPAGDGGEGSAVRIIAMPELPKDGSYVVTGSITATDTASPRKAVTYFPQFTGTIEGGKVSQNNTGPVPSQPTDGGAAQEWKPGGPSAVVTGRQMEIEVLGVSGKKLQWSWALRVVLTQQ